MSEFHNYRYTAQTHVGLKRKVNEDTILSLPDQDIWLVADGMGGHQAGDFASRAVADSVAMIPQGLIRQRACMHCATPSPVRIK
ncbi:hypothetical protein [Parasedimentitalea marina]|uniref:PP2C family protein-serine/threonine phosphatase n=1 Tax=Parasedimentitalea marina TaxID=2483033 RepID=UPI0026A827E5